jgi:hypothetical protein
MDEKQRLVFQMFQTQRPVLCEMTGLAQDHGQSFFEKLLGRESECIERRTQKPHVDVARDQCLGLEAGCDVLNVDFYTRKKPQMPIDDAADDVSQSFANTNPDGADFPILRLAGYFNGS